MTRQNKPSNQNDKVQAPIQLTPTQCNEVSGGYGDGYTVHPGIEGKYTNIWPK
jgi:hypothetical protein